MSERELQQALRYINEQAARRGRGRYETATLADRKETARLRERNHTATQQHRMEQR